MIKIRLKTFGFIMMRSFIILLSLTANSSSSSPVVLNSTSSNLTTTSLGLSSELPSSSSITFTMPSTTDHPVNDEEREESESQSFLSAAGSPSSSSSSESSYISGPPYSAMSYNVKNRRMTTPIAVMKGHHSKSGQQSSSAISSRYSKSNISNMIAGNKRIPSADDDSLHDDRVIRNVQSGNKKIQMESEAIGTAEIDFNPNKPNSGVHHSMMSSIFGNNSMRAIYSASTSNSMCPSNWLQHPITASSSSAAPTISGMMSDTSIKQSLVNCSCYGFDEGLFIECSDLMSVKKSLQSIPSAAIIKSYTIYKLNPDIKTFPVNLFINSSNIERIRISESALEGLEGYQTFKGLESSLKSLSIVSSKLKSIPEKSLIGLKNLESLDFESNEIREIYSFSLKGLPLINLNLQSNLINHLEDNSFGGLESSLEELILINNNLTSFPLTAVRRLNRIKVIKLNNNHLSEIPESDSPSLNPATGSGLITLQHLDLRSNQFLHLTSKSFNLFPNLVTISLSSNQLTSLDEDRIFSFMKELEAVDLSRNSIQNINANSFDGLSKLKTIDLSYNQLHHLENGLFNNLPNLREIFLTKNNILQLTNNTFAKSPQINSIFLDHNSIQVIDSDVFTQLSQLFQLHLSFNQINHLPKKLFANNLNLRSLSLDNNRIDSLNIDIFGHEMIELRDLRLDKNLLENITLGIFDSFPNLQELHLQNNLIQFIEADSFKKLVNLEYLNLQGNQLVKLNNILNNLQSLRHLQLNQNHLKSIEANSFVGLQQLEVLWLSNNHLGNITKNSFHDLKAIEKLYLDHNEVSLIENQSFKHLENLILLNLEFNNIRKVSNGMFDGLKTLESLDLSHNPIEVIEMSAVSQLANLKSLKMDSSQLVTINHGVLFFKKFRSSSGQLVSAVPTGHLDTSTDPKENVHDILQDSQKDEVEFFLNHHKNNGLKKVDFISDDFKTSPLSKSMSINQFKLISHYVAIILFVITIIITVSNVILLLTAVIIRWRRMKGNQRLSSSDPDPDHHLRPAFDSPKGGQEIMIHDFNPVQTGLTTLPPPPPVPNDNKISNMMINHSNSTFSFSNHHPSHGHHELNQHHHHHHHLIGPHGHQQPTHLITTHHHNEYQNVQEISSTSTPPPPPPAVSMTGLSPSHLPSSTSCHQIGTSSASCQINNHPHHVHHMMSTQANSSNSCIQTPDVELPLPDDSSYITYRHFHLPSNDDNNQHNNYI